MKKGFTLAEVLITLGIIGVVAALTMPTLISRTNGIQFKTAYKKAFSVLNQAIKMNVALDDQDFSTLVADTSGDGSVSRTMSYILKNRMQGATDLTAKYDTENAWAKANNMISYTTNYSCTASDVQAATNRPWEYCYQKQPGDAVTVSIAGPASNVKIFVQKAYGFMDGTVLAYHTAGANCTGIHASCIGYIDVNGPAGPNAVTECDSGTRGKDCVVSPQNIKDVYLVFFYGQSFAPASDAARAVLISK